jgi:hypothetical protein
MTEDASHQSQPRLPPYIANQREEPQPAAGAGSEVSPVRPFIITSGRAEPIDETLEIEAQVETTEFGMRSGPLLAFERRDIVALCARTMSVAEVGARLGLQIGVVRVLVAELAAAGYLLVSRPSSQLSQDLDLIERVIRGFEAIH